jgi:hypothetical protein
VRVHDTKHLQITDNTVELQRLNEALCLGIALNFGNLVTFVRNSVVYICSGPVGGFYR